MATNIHSFPLDAGKMPHAMAFYINVDTESRFYNAGESTDILQSGTDIQNKIGTGFSSSNINDLRKYAMGSDIGSSILGGAKAVGGGITTFVNDVTGGSIDAIKSSDFAKSFEKGVTAQFTKKMKRMNSAILLPMPKAISTNYGMSWNGDEGMGSGIGAALLQNTSQGQAQGEINGSFAAGILGEVASRNAAKKGAALLGQNEKIVDLKTRRLENPRKEQLFNGVNFRNFSFEWVLYPTNAKEMEEIKTIVNLFKLHMHPELSNGNFFYIYPSEFDMEFQFNGKQNTNMPKISTCVLKTCSVGYTPDNEFISMKDGNVNGISLKLEFTETELLTKDRIAAGY